MDRFDQAILAELERDARQSFGAIAERVGLSKTPCWNRVQALERQGVIEGYRAVVNSEALGLFLNAFVQVSVEFGAYRSFEKAVLEHPAILDCYTTAGSADYIMHIVAEDAAALDALLREDLCNLPGISRFSTTICMKRIKRGGSLVAARDSGGHRREPWVDQPPVTR
jgi:Lrp/AsnC family leucine-responsive transcriptional regulator